MRLILLFLLTSFTSFGQYAGMTPVKFNSSLQGLVRLPASYNTLNKKYPLILHFCGNGETADKGGLNLLMNTGYGRQVALNRVQGTQSDSIINIIVQSPSSGAISQPNLINAVIDYVLANYRVDTTKDENGKYKFILLAALSQGAADIWAIASWDKSVTAYGIAKYSDKIKYLWPASIPSLFPSTVAYQRMKGDVVHFVHGTNDAQGCCAFWPVPDMVTALNNNGSVATLAAVQGAGHDNTCWDSCWSAKSKDTTTNMYLMVQRGWGAPTSWQPCKFSYAQPTGAMFYEPNGKKYSDHYELSSGEVIIPIQVF